jgi:hypothetical protein
MLSGVLDEVSKPKKHLRALPGRTILPLGEGSLGRIDRVVDLTQRGCSIGKDIARSRWVDAHNLFSGSRYSGTGNESLKVDGVALH